MINRKHTHRNTDNPQGGGDSTPEHQALMSGIVAGDPDAEDGPIRSVASYVGGTHRRETAMGGMRRKKGKSTYPFGSDRGLSIDESTREHDRVSPCLSVIRTGIRYSLKLPIKG